DPPGGGDPFDRSKVLLCVQEETLGDSEEPPALRVELDCGNAWFLLYNTHSLPVQVPGGVTDLTQPQSLPTHHRTLEFTDAVQDAPYCLSTIYYGSGYQCNVWGPDLTDR